VVAFVELAQPLERFGREDRPVEALRFDAQAVGEWSAVPGAGGFEVGAQRGLRQRCDGLGERDCALEAGTAGRGGDLGRAGVDQFPGRGLEITAGAERFVTRAGEDTDQGGVVDAEAVPGVDQLAMCLRPNGVPALRPVDREIVTGPRRW
jgi:hypothetical protein